MPDSVLEMRQQLTSSARRRSSLLQEGLKELDEKTATPALRGSARQAAEALRERRQQMNKLMKVHQTGNEGQADAQDATTSMPFIPAGAGGESGHAFAVAQADSLARRMSLDMGTLGLVNRGSATRSSKSLARKSHLRRSSTRRRSIDRRPSVDTGRRPSVVGECHDEDPFGDGAVSLADRT